MVNEVFIVSSSSGSGIDINIPLFILAASSSQFEIPTKAILLSPSFKSYSNSEWIIFRGLYGEYSARPISSKNIIGIIFFLSSFDKFFSIFLVLENTLSTPLEVLPIDPWYELIINFGINLNNGLFDELPFIALFINWTLRDLLHPGLPTIKIGTLFIIVVNNENIFSSKALFLEIPFSNLIFLSKYSCSNFGISRKSVISGDTSFNFSHNLIFNSLLEIRK